MATSALKTALDVTFCIASVFPATNLHICKHCVVGIYVYCWQLKIYIVGCPELLLWPNKVFQWLFVGCGERVIVINVSLKKLVRRVCIIFNTRHFL